MTHGDKAIIYIPTGDYDEHIARGYQHIERQGYEFVGVIRGDWQEAVRMLYDGRADVGVVASEEYLDPARRPRFEYLSHFEPPPAGRKTRNAAPVRQVHRSRLIRQDEE